MDAGKTPVDELAQTIRDYLSTHPNAADTLEGVATWWLSGSTDKHWLAHVERAMEQLVRQGEVARQILRDGTVIYERNKDHDRR